LVVLVDGEIPCLIETPHAGRWHGAPCCPERGPQWTL
jgi:hypothetical protein